MARIIPLGEAAFHQTIDPNGNLFWWNGEPYRAVRRHHVNFTLGLFRSGIVDDLTGRGLLVATEVTDLTIKGFPLVLRHKRVPFNARFGEWNAGMFRDAALTHLDLECALESLGLMLQDGHTDNVLFDGAQPVFVDFCSIVPNIAARVWEAEDEFRRNFLNPLRLFSTGQSELLRATMRSDRRGVAHSVVNPSAALPPASRPAQIAAHAKARTRAVLPEPAFAWLKRQQRQVQRRVADRDSDAGRVRAGRLAVLREEIVALTFPACDPPAAAPLPPPPELHAVLAALLERLRPASVLDLTESGQCADYAAQQGIAAAVFAQSECERERAYHDARAAGRPLLPVCIPPDDRNHEPGWLARSHDLGERYHADLVTALNVHPPPEPARQVQLLEGIRRFSRRWVLLSGEWLDEPLRADFGHIERVDSVLLCAGHSLTGHARPHSVD